MIAGFKATNHPQQTGKRGAVDAVDDRGTPQEFIDALEARFGKFTLDVAAAPHNAKAPWFYTREDDGLSQPWGWYSKHDGVDRMASSMTVWCNPPYSDCGAWVQKAWEEWDGPTGWISGSRGLSAPRKILMLLPANRVEQAWWQDHVEPYRDRPGSPLRVEFQRGRMRFDRPDWTPGPKGDRPRFGVALLIWKKDA